MEVANLRRSTVFIYKKYKPRVNLVKRTNLVKTSWMLERLQLYETSTRVHKAFPGVLGGRADGLDKAN